MIFDGVRFPSCVYVFISFSIDELLAKPTLLLFHFPFISINAYHIINPD